MCVEKLKKYISESDNIVFFGGAGVSTESNIPDFRSETGIYNTKNRYGFPPETILSHTFFCTNTALFYTFYKSSMVYKDAKPNDAHKALALLELRGKLKAVITQNIDGLHQAAGSVNVLELHGTIHRNTCLKCGRKYGLEFVMGSPGVPKCPVCSGIIKPDVTLYEEQLDYNVIERAVHYIEQADLMIVGGTSLSVYPAAGLIDYYRGNKLVLINNSTTPFDDRANLLIHDSIGKTLLFCICP